MPRWIEAAKVDGLPASGGIEVVVDGRIIALFRLEEGIFAVDGICAHQGGPVGQGELSGCVVTCPWHGWQYDVRTGEQQITPSIKLATFPVRIDGDTILVDVGDGEST